MQKITIDSLAKQTIAPGASAQFSVKPEKIETHDAAQATVDYQIPPD